MSEKETLYREVLVRFAKGEATREEVRAADPMRTTIRKAAEIVASAYVSSQTAKAR
ncbi:hypothetical protein GCM10008939_06800 [Deinococcus aquiradiocola]|uniref:Uncharacterized protein n=1 Tax=Deinococcus aquiradiocola TaxID=393059 RepID=A0A917P7H3_9DEIO|nr:hypothetical protein GCM10008939_06800 [Deinococcus aquiradiocola]